MEVYKKLVLLKSWKRLVKLLSVERGDIFQIIGYAIFSGLISLSLPIGIQAIINLIQGAKITASWVVLIILVALGVVFSGVFQVMQMRIIENIQQRIFVRSSFELSYRFPKISLESTRGYYLPELANRFFDTITIQKGLSKLLIDVPFALLQILFGLIILSLYNPFFIIFGAAMILIFYFAFRHSLEKGITTSLEESNEKYKVVHWIQEIARSMISFKMSGNTSLGLKKNDILTENYLEKRENHFKVIVFQFLKMIGFKAIVTVGLLIIGGLLVLNQQMNIGQFVASEIIILLIVGSVEKLISGLESVYDTLTSVEKLGKITDINLDIQNQKNTPLDDGFSIELKKIDYKVPEMEQSLLKDFSFHFQKGKTYLIHGKIGTGKSTLLKIITSMIPPSKGNIFINQVPLYETNLNTYRSKIASFFQEETPFEGTFRENLVFDNAIISDEKILEILEILGLMPFFKNLKKGFATQLAPEGKFISHNTALRIVMARAILKEKKWLVLENPLDIFEEEEFEKIVKFLLKINENTGLIVASNHKIWQSEIQEKIEFKKDA